MKFSTSALFLVLLAGFTTGPGAETLSVAVPPIEHLLDRENTGIYQTLMSRALKDTDITLDQQFYPYRRALAAFENGKVDCIFSFTDILLKRAGPDKVVYSYPFGAFRFHLFTLPDTRPLVSLDKNRTMLFGAVQGHEVYLKSHISGDVAIEWVRTQPQLIRMLQLGRIDAIIAAMPDMQPHTGQLAYQPDNPLIEAYDRLNCHVTKNNLEMLTTISENLRQLHGQGVYQDIAGDLYLPFQLESSPGSIEEP